MKPDELRLAIESHALWLRGVPGGKCANLSDANLYGARSVSDLAVSQFSILPAGRLIVWKKCREDVVVKLAVPEDARRSNATGRKCRAERVVVLAVFGGDVGVSLHDGVTTYRVDEVVACDRWCEDRWVECGGGIHFFITREEAEAYTG